MRRRLVLLSIAVTTTVVVAFSIPLGLLLRDLAEDRAVGTAEREANALARTLAVLGEVDEATTTALISGSGDRVQLAVLRADGTVIGEAKITELSGRSRLVEEYDGVASYVPVVGLTPQTEVRGWVGSDELRRNVDAAWTVLAVLGVLLVGVAALMADRLGRSMVDPVVALAEATESLGEGDLTVTVEPSGPEELRAVGNAFNRLVGRVNDLLTAERESVADVSHRLRTPLTAVRLNAERVGGDDELVGSIDRLERAVDSVIETARRPIHRDAGGSVDLGALTRTRVAFWKALAVDQDRVVEQRIAERSVMVSASAAEVEALIDALLENVFAHTPDGTNFEVGVSSDGVLAVRDDGPGFSAEALVGRGESGAGGTGLGLDIARSTAEASGGALTIESRPEGGSAIVVRFGVTD